MTRPLSITVIAVSLLAFHAPLLPAATLTVDDDGSTPYSSIQAAINAAVNDDVIVVRSGSYRETLNFLGKAITVQSENGPENTTIFLEQETRIVLLDGDSTLRGFTITGGRSRVGGGILVTNGAAAVIEGNIIENNLASRSGSAYPAFGGGIAVELLSEPVITRNIIRNNRAEGDEDGLLAYGAGIDLGDDTSATITNNIIASNTTTDSGGGISIGLAGTSTPVRVVNNTIVQNQAGEGNPAPISYGGGILVESGAEVELSNNLIAANVAELDGGGVYFFANGLQGITYLNNDFDANTPNDCAGIAANKCDGGQLFLTPLFLDPGVGNYRPRSDSPILDQGTASGAPVIDGDGRPRPVDGDLDGISAPDIGAHENQAEITRLRFDSRTVLAWDGSPNAAMTFDLYRDDLALLGSGNVGECLQPDLAAATYTDLDTPFEGSGFIYLVSGQDAATGTMGFDSGGTERTAAAACP